MTKQQEKLRDLLSKVFDNEDDIEARMALFNANPKEMIASRNSAMAELARKLQKFDIPNDTIHARLAEATGLEKESVRVIIYNNTPHE